MFGNFRDITAHTAEGISSSTHIFCQCLRRGEVKAALSIFCPQQGTQFCSVHRHCTYFRKTQSEQRKWTKKRNKDLSLLWVPGNRTDEQGLCSETYCTCKLCSVQHPTSLHNANRSQGTCKVMKAKRNTERTLLQVLWQIQMKKSELYAFHDLGSFSTLCTA